MLDQSLPRTTQARKIRPAYLAHVVLRTAQPEALIEWYCKVLSAEIAHASELITFLTYDEEHHRIAIAKMPVLGKRAMSRSGVDHFSFSYASLEDLLAQHQALHEVGIEPIWSINHGPTISLYYRDPDRNVVELQVDTFETAEEFEALTGKLDFDDNPIGVDIDPFVLKARLDAGEDPAILMERPVIGPRSATSLPRSYVGGFASGVIRLAKALGAKV